MSRTRRPRTPLNAIRFRLSGGSGLRLEHFSEAAVAQALEAHADILRRSGAGILKRDRRSQITVTVADGRPVVVKQVVKGGTRRRIADGCRGSPARRAWRAGHGLLALGIGACTPLAFLETRRHGLPETSTVVLEDLRPAVASSEYAARGPAEARAALDALCRLVIDLHRNRIAYADLRAQHVFVRHASGQGTGPLETALIDLESVRFAGRLSEGHRIQCLAELNASLADDLATTGERLVAFESYSRTLPFPRGARRALTEIVRRSLARKHLWAATGCGPRPP